MCAAGGTSATLPAAPKAIEGWVVPQPDRGRAGLSWNPSGQADLVLGELDVATGSLTHWAEAGGFWEWGAWSPDGGRAAVVKLMGTPAEAYVLRPDGSLTRRLPRALPVIPVAG